MVSKDKKRKKKQQAYEHARKRTRLQSLPNESLHFENDRADEQPATHHSQNKSDILIKPQIKRRKTANAKYYASHRERISCKNALYKANHPEHLIVNSQYKTKHKPGMLTRPRPSRPRPRPRPRPTRPRPRPRPSRPRPRPRPSPRGRGRGRGQAHKAEAEPQIKTYMFHYAM